MNDYFSNRRTFNTATITPGQLVTVVKNNETKSGVVTNVSPTELSFAHYANGGTEVAVITEDDLNNQAVAIHFSTHVNDTKETNKTNEQKTKTETKEPQQSQTSSSFSFDVLKKVTDIDPLLSLISRMNIKPEVIAFIAKHLTRKQQSKLLFMLPNHLMNMVQEQMDKPKINEEPVKKEAENVIRSILDDLLKRQEEFKNKKRPNENSRKQQTPPQNPFEQLFGGAFGNSAPGGGMEGIFEMFQQFTGGQNGDIEHQMNEMFGQVQEILENLMQGFDQGQDDDDDDDEGGMGFR